MGDAHTHFDCLAEFWIVDAGEYRRPVAERTAGLIKPASIASTPPVGDGHPNVGHFHVWNQRCRKFPPSRTILPALCHPAPGLPGPPSLMSASP